MKNFREKLIPFVLVTGWIFIIVSGFLGYFVSSFDEARMVPVDGLGRELTQAPMLAKIFLLGSDTWAGFLWFIVDYVIFWGFMAISLIASGINE